MRKAIARLRSNRTSSEASAVCAEMAVAQFGQPFSGSVLLPFLHDALPSLLFCFVVQPSLLLGAVR
jgi:hypothetical protein